MPLASVLVGAVVLLAGRRLFWLFVGVAGFVAAAAVVGRVFDGLPTTTVLVIAIIAGLVGAIVAVLVKRIAVGVAGFILGGFVAVTLLDGAGIELGTWVWGVYLFAGLLGAVLVSTLFDWALIVLSSLTGAVVILQWTHMRPAPGLLLIGALAVIGIAVQVRQLHAPHRRRRPN